MPSAVFWITVVFTAALALIFFRVIQASQSETSSEQVVSAAGAFRQSLFWSLLILGGALTYYTLDPWPHRAAAGLTEGKPIIVSVTGAQWSWHVSRDKLPVGKPVVFAVTSTDVNHGMGLYDQDYKLLTQVQGMPGYINRVEYTFDKPGKYRLLCLEYCGLAHHDMRSEITVTAN